MGVQNTFIWGGGGVCVRGVVLPIHPDTINPQISFMILLCSNCSLFLIFSFGPENELRYHCFVLCCIFSFLPIQYTKKNCGSMVRYWYCELFIAE